jgi:alanine dehydrogenase
MAYREITMIVGVPKETKSDEVTLPWALHIANRGLLPAVQSLPPVARAINIYEGEVTNRPVAETFGMLYNPRFEK